MRETREDEEACNNSVREAGACLWAWEDSLSAFSLTPSDERHAFLSARAPILLLLLWEGDLSLHMKLTCGGKIRAPIVSIKSSHLKCQC